MKTDSARLLFRGAMAAALVCVIALSPVGPLSTPLSFLFGLCVGWLLFDVCQTVYSQVQ